MFVFPFLGLQSIAQPSRETDSDILFLKGAIVIEGRVDSLSSGRVYFTRWDIHKAQTFNFSEVRLLLLADGRYLSRAQMPSFAGLTTIGDSLPGDRIFLQDGSAMVGSIESMTEDSVRFILRDMTESRPIGKSRVRLLLYSNGTYIAHRNDRKFDPNLGGVLIAFPDFLPRDPVKESRSRHFKIFAGRPVPMGLLASPHPFPEGGNANAGVSYGGEMFFDFGEWLELGLEGQVYVNTAGSSPELHLIGNDPRKYRYVFSDADKWQAYSGMVSIGTRRNVYKEFAVYAKAKIGVMSITPPSIVVTDVYHDTLALPPTHASLPFGFSAGVQIFSRVDLGFQYIASETTLNVTETQQRTLRYSLEVFSFGILF